MFPGAQHTPRFLLRVIPFEDESLAGYILRATEKNGYEEVSWVLKEIGCKASEIHQEHQIHRLANFTGAPFDTLWNLSYSPVSARGSKVRLIGKPVRRYHIDPIRPKICPVCLTERGYCRAEWDIRVVVACWKHGQRLIDACGGCGQRLSWTRPSVSRCVCGYNLLSSGSEPADDAVTALMHSIHIICSTPEVGNRRARSPLEVSSPFDLLEMVHLLSAYSTANREAGRRVSFGRIDLSQAYTLVREAAEILNDWPRGFHNFLDEIRRNREGAGESGGLIKSFGGFYSALVRRLQTQSLDLFHGQFEAYLSNNWSIGDTKRMRWVGNLRNAKLLNRTKAAELLGVAPQTVDVLLRHNEIHGRIDRIGPRSIATIDKQSVLRYRARRKNILGVEEAAQLLGISRATYRKLVDQRIVYCAVGQNPRLRKAYETDRSAIQRLLSRLDHAIEDKPGVPGISFHQAVLRLATLGFDGARVVRAILTGQIAIVGKDDNKPGLAQYLLSGPDVQIIAERKDRERRPVVWIQKPIRALTTEEAMPTYLVGRPPQALIARREPLPR